MTANRPLAAASAPSIPHDRNPIEKCRLLSCTSRRPLTKKRRTRSPDAGVVARLAAPLRLRVIIARRMLWSAPARRRFLLQLLPVGFLHGPSIGAILGTIGTGEESPREAPGRSGFRESLGVARCSRARRTPASVAAGAARSSPYCAQDIATGGGIRADSFCFDGRREPAGRIPPLVARQ
jgi:hypothetical protein